MCVVSCAENIGAHHTQYFLIFMCDGSTDKKSLKIYKIPMCVPPFSLHEQGCSELDLSTLDLSELDVADCLSPLLPHNNQCIKSLL